MWAVGGELRAGVVRRAIVALVAVVLVSAGCSGSDEGAQGATSTTGAPTQGSSIVVLGDSVAAGEGIDYGYTYDPGPPARWTGGTTDPSWEPPYPLCHSSAKAYGHLVADALGADLSTFACTGSSYPDGIAGPRIQADTGTEMRPAQLGTADDPAPDYVAARPDVVIITLGANDISFSDIAVFCATGASAVEDQQAGAATADPAQVGSAADAQRVADEASAQASAPGGPDQQDDAARCTEENPTATVQQLFWDQLPVLEEHYRQLVADIQALGDQAGHVPEIVVTTYYSPLPSDQSAVDACVDGAVYSADQLSYLSSLLTQLNTTITDAVGSIDGVHVADLADVMDGHEWCTEDPWAYGPSVLILDPTSKAPVHPTPEGQAAIAQVVEQTIQGI